MYHNSESRKRASAARRGTALFLFQLDSGRGAGDLSGIARYTCLPPLYLWVCTPISMQKSTRIIIHSASLTLPLSDAPLRRC